MLNKRILVLMFVVAFLLLVGCGPSPAVPNRVPIITSDPITTATVGEAYTYDVNATDPDGDTLTYSLATPAGMTINSATGLIMWIPTSAQVGNNLVTVKVSDGTLYITQSFTIVVSEPPAPPAPPAPPVNHAPTINSTPVTTATVGVNYFYGVNATDPDGDTLTYSLATPAGMTINSANGLIKWTPTSAQVGNNLVTVMVSDGALSDTQSFTIVVSEPPAPPAPPVNKPPIADAGPDRIVVMETLVEITFVGTGTDSDGTVILYSWDFGDSGTGTGATVGHAYSALGAYTVTLTVMDDDGATDSDTMSLKIFDTIQKGINASNPINLIEVMAGTYNENIIIDKSLTIVSIDGALVTIIDAQGVPIAVLINGASTVATFDGFTVDNYDTIGILAGAFSTVLQGVTLGDDPFEVDILNNIVMPPTLAPPHNNNIQIGDGTTGTVIGNEVSGALLESPDWSGSGILVAGSSNVLISNNYVHNSEGGIQILGYEYKNAPAEDNLIENNLVEDCKAGISVQGYSIGTIIRYNDVFNNNTGIGSLAYDFSYEQSTPSDTEIHYNNIVGNVNYGVKSSVWWHHTEQVFAEEVDATGNWWGDESGPYHPTTNPFGLGNEVSDNVDYGDWLTSPY